MRVIVQRSLESHVEVDKKVVGAISSGLVLLVGFHVNDTEEDVYYMVKKILNLRIFNDTNGVMNRSILEEQTSILSISQFTLYGSTIKGNRPSYIEAMRPEKAKNLYNLFNEELKKQILVETGIFGADMKVSIKNDGPVTIILESRNKNDQK